MYHFFTKWVLFFLTIISSNLSLIILKVVLLDASLFNKYDDTNFQILFGQRTGLFNLKNRKSQKCHFMTRNKRLKTIILIKILKNKVNLIKTENIFVSIFSQVVSVILKETYQFVLNLVV